MDCGYFEELITAGLDGELSPEEEAALHAHLESCGNCRRFQEAMRAISGAAARDLPPAPEGFSDAVMARVRAAAPEKKKKPIRFPGRVLALAAAAAVVLWAGVRLAGPFRGMGSAAPSAASMKTAESAAEEAPPQAAEPETPMMAMDQGVLARGADAAAADAAPAENGAAGFVMMAPAAAPAEAGAPEITVREGEILFRDRVVTLEELESLLLDDGVTGPVSLLDDHAVKETWDAVTALLSRLEIPLA